MGPGITGVTQLHSLGHVHKGQLLLAVIQLLAANELQPHD